MSDELENMIRELPLREPSRMLDQRVLSVLAAQSADGPPAGMKGGLSGKGVLRITRRWPVACLGAAAAILLLVSLLPLFLPDRYKSMPPVGGPTPPVQFADSTRNKYPKETDPCNILPPVPDWQ